MTAEKPVKIKEPKVFTQPEPVTDIMPLLETAWDEGTDIKAVLLKNDALSQSQISDISDLTALFLKTAGLRNVCWMDAALWM